MRVVIIGGGIAGAGAARVLRKSGRQPIVLKAAAVRRKRLPARIHTTSNEIQITHIAKGLQRT